MAEPLTPEEIDALLNSLKESAPAAAAEPVVETAPTPEFNPVPFGDLSRETADRLSAVAESLRTMLEKALKPVLSLPFSTRVSQVGLAWPTVAPTTFLRLNPGALIGALDFDANLATAMADRLMGGQARPASRPVGELEQAILAPIFEDFATSLAYALRHYGLSVTTFQDEEARFDAGVQAAIEFDLNGLKGAVRVLLPNLFTPAVETEATVESNDWIIELGQAELTAHALIDLKVGQIVKLDRHADANLVLKAGEASYTGRPVLDGDRMLFAVVGGY